MLRTLLISIESFVFSATLAMTLAQSTVAQTSTVRVASGLTLPLYAGAPAGDTERLFIAEQYHNSDDARIKILDLTTGVVQATPFIELTGLATGGEQGLLGVAFDPDYANNGHFYVNVTTDAGSGDTHIRRYTADGPNPLTATSASLSSQHEILSFNQPQGNHNGGWIGFSPNDDHLYIATGDGGSGNDSGTGHTANIGNAQDITNNLLGKMLRVDVNGDDFIGDATRNYAVPADNPFVNATGDDEIWSYGLRNPYRSSFDRATGDLWIGDVGQGQREEVDYQPADSTGGENYGWRLREGDIATPGVGGPKPPGNVDPIHDYTRGNGALQGTTVIGGHVYRGPVEHFQGHYLFSDIGSGNIWKLDPDAIDPSASVTRINNDLTPDAGSLSQISSFGEDDAGNLYLTARGGNVFRVTSASQDAIWNGDDAGAGAVGNGTTWVSDANWTRGDTVDQAIVTEDHAIFAAGSSQSTINLGNDRTVSAVTFQADYTLTDFQLTVLSGNITVDSGVTATIEATLAADSTNHSLRKLGGGTLLVNGLAGQVAVKAGTLGGQGTMSHLTVQAGGTVAPGTTDFPTGQLTVQDSFTMVEGATLAVEIGGTSAVEDYDLLAVTGTAAIDGTLDVSFIDGFQPSAGDAFTFLNAESLVGEFDSVTIPSIAGQLVGFISLGVNTAELIVTFGADFDRDLDVDGADLLAIQLADPSLVPLWQDQYGNDASALAAAEQVPEPATGLLLLASLALAPLRRKP
ncbi:PQQ-dependent sugar dehydrogenase [Adhaeretor mobilis]|uniref:Soluble aldose sugar dehydrogenase YliI n=1 Tax=Adhaeretor mobilis TaxID=1930276 RepID=A0A517N3L7_9BACT|nr:PQQ-dependent sugar dehydrogenase [Adhaeretor mobilis]QDT01588.1 Soluble aldose sugar dehydrogenase YliI precursor [Adhaeretor mobilis]